MTPASVPVLGLAEAEERARRFAADHVFGLGAVDRAHAELWAAAARYTAVGAVPVYEVEVEGVLKRGCLGGRAYLGRCLVQVHGDDGRPLGHRMLRRGSR